MSAWVLPPFFDIFVPVVLVEGEAHLTATLSGFRGLGRVHWGCGDLEVT